MSLLSGYNRIVVKVGSALLIANNQLRQEWLTKLCEDVAALRAGGADVLIVSSGAIALGRNVLELTGSKLSLTEKQASAAAGQTILTRAYDDALSTFGYRSAQALLTIGDTENRRNWLNARATLSTLLSLGVIPIVNENDTVATAEIRYGDNDRLAARTAQMIGADLLVLLSDIDGLYTGDPRQDPHARHIPSVDLIDADILAMGGPANAQTGVGSGGMATKLLAAQIATQAGCDMIICDGRDIGALDKLNQNATHTHFKASSHPRNARALWISGSLAPVGTLRIDAGAVIALRSGRSLLLAGLKSASGPFDKGDTVRIIGPDNVEIALGLSSYDSRDAEPLCGLRSGDITHPSGPVIVHRDNMVLT